MSRFLIKDPTQRPGGTSGGKHRVKEGGRGKSGGKRKKEKKKTEHRTRALRNNRRSPSTI